MKKKIFIAAATLFSFVLKAQDSTKALDEVIVTANKFPNKVSLTGKVVTVISKEQIEKSGSKDLAQILSEQGGIYINGANSNAGKDKSIFIRGAKIDHTLITIDGVPVYDASGIGSNFDIRLFSLDNVEQIEILKGSQSTLYGSDAIAGVINIITKKASSKKINCFGGLTYGSYNSIHENIGLNGTKDEFNYNLNYSYLKTQGINEIVDTSVYNPKKTDNDGYKQENFYATFGWNPNKNVSVQPYLRFAKINGDIDQEAFIDELDYNFGLKNLQVGVKNNFKIGKCVLNLMYNNNDIKRIFIDDSSKSRNGWYKYYYGKYTSNEHFAEANLLIPFNDAIKLTLGSDYRHSSTFQVFENVGLFDNNLNYASIESAKQNQLSLFAALNINSKSGLNIEAGGRLNNHSSYGNNLSFNLNPSYLIMQRFKIFANLSSGYKTPSLFQLFSEYGNNSLKPEVSINTEAGLQYQTLNGKLSGRLTYYNRTIRDVIIFYYNPTSYKSNYINQDKQFNNGVELEASLSFYKSNSLKVSYAYTDGKVTTIENGKDTSYFNLIRQPKSVFSLTLNSKINKFNSKVFKKRFSFHDHCII